MPNQFDPLRLALRYYKLSASAQASDTTSFFSGSTSVLLAQRLANAPAATKTCDVAKEMQALVVDGVPHELGPMEGYVLPGGVEHSAYCGPEGALVLDVFQPVREDYRDAWERNA